MQFLIHRYKFHNLDKVDFDFSSSNTRLLLTNRFFKSIGFVSSMNKQENSLAKIIYKNNNQIFENKILLNLIY